MEYRTFSLQNAQDSAGYYTPVESTIIEETLPLEIRADSVRSNETVRRRHPRQMTFRTLVFCLCFSVTLSLFLRLLPQAIGAFPVVTGNGAAEESPKEETAFSAFTGVPDTEPESTVPVSSPPVLTISNETGYAVDTDALLNEPLKEDTSAVAVFARADGDPPPEVLIFHTHGTEGYATDSEGVITNELRSENTGSNVVRIGDELAEVFSSHGIGVIHCREMFDKDSYIRAYANSREAVSDYLKRYPTIRWCIDLHRDAVSDGENYVKVSYDNNGEETARMMFVIGTDEGGADHPEWQENLKRALHIQKSMEITCPGLMRPIYLRKASFNQQLCPGACILEAGSCANTLEEVLRGIRLFGEAFSSYLHPQEEMEAL